jgi:hypothetical protein
VTPVCPLSRPPSSRAPFSSARDVRENGGGGPCPAAGLGSFLCPQPADFRKAGCNGGDGRRCIDKNLTSGFVLTSSLFHDVIFILRGMGTLASLSK